MGWSFFNLFNKGDEAYCFLRSCMFMPVVPAILTINKSIAVDSETVCLWLADHSFDRAMKILCCL